MAPDKTVSFMYEQFNAAFNSKLLGNYGNLQECWDGISDDDPRVAQLLKDHHDYKSKCIPLVIHGDGVPCT